MQYAAHRLCRLLCFLTGCLLLPALAHAQQLSVDGIAKSDWPWWRGPARNGFAAEAQLPTKFGNSENVLWKSPVPGRGHSSPIVVGGKVYLATADEAKQLHAVLAYDMANGDRIWAKQISQGGFPKQNHPKNTEASTTIASDGKSLFVTFFHHETVTLTALDMDGGEKWTQVVSPFNPKLYKYGYAPSPLIYGESVIVSAEYDGKSSITAFNRTTGKKLWNADRPANITFSSPVVANVAGRDQLLISGSGLVASYNPSNGTPFWSVKGTTSATCGSMVWDGNIVFASGGYPRPQTIAVLANGSNRVLWTNGQKCYEQSMIVVDGYLYGLVDHGVLYCWRGTDGKEMWRTRLAGPVSASPIYAGGHIYWANEAGTMYVFKPNPQRFELVAENRIGKEAFASPAVSGNKLLLRVAEGKGSARKESLICIGNAN
ncbi:MAG: PQQ-binding-like beta-propeller repeat protein [Planctomycetota bacterium]